MCVQVSRETCRTCTKRSSLLQIRHRFRVNVACIDAFSVGSSWRNATAWPGGRPRALAPHARNPARAGAKGAGSFRLASGDAPHRHRRPRAAGLLLLPCPPAVRQHPLSALRTGEPGAARGRGARNPPRGAAGRARTAGPRPGGYLPGGADDRPGRVRRGVRSARYRPAAPVGGQGPPLRSALELLRGLPFHPGDPRHRQAQPSQYHSDSLRRRRRGAGLLRHAVPRGAHRRGAAPDRGAARRGPDAGDRRADPGGPAPGARARSGTPRHQAGEHRDRGRHRPAAAGGFRDREEPRGPGRHHRDRVHRRHAAVHESGAGAGQPQGRSPLGHLRHGRRALPSADRRAAFRR